MNKLMLMVVVTGMMLVQGCDENNEEPSRDNVNDSTQMKPLGTITGPSSDELYATGVYPAGDEVETEAPIVVDDYAKIRTFLILHSEFGSYASAVFIMDLPAGGKAYNARLANGRTLQFFFNAGTILAVGEEVNGGFMVHYGRM